MNSAQTPVLPNKIMLHLETQCPQCHQVLEIKPISATSKVCVLRRPND